MVNLKERQCASPLFLLSLSGCWLHRHLGSVGSMGRRDAVEQQREFLGAIFGCKSNCVTLLVVVVVVDHSKIFRDS